MKEKDKISKLLDKYESEEDTGDSVEDKDNGSFKKEAKPARSKKENEGPKAGIEDRGIVKLDLKDRKLLRELDRNCRQSNSEIGKKIRLNKNTVNYKIKRLENEGVLSSYYAVIDNSKLGYFSFRSYLKFFNTTPEDEENIINWLKEDERV
jgi:hypothetical protein